MYIYKYICIHIDKMIQVQHVSCTFTYRPSLQRYPAAWQLFMLYGFIVLASGNTADSCSFYCYILSQQQRDTCSPAVSVTCTILGSANERQLYPAVSAASITAPKMAEAVARLAAEIEPGVRDLEFCYFASVHSEITWPICHFHPYRAMLVMIACFR